MVSRDRSVDFPVVGSGAAGMTGALRAHDLGSATLLVEKAPGSEDRPPCRAARSGCPSRGPVERPPLYAVKVDPGDLGTKRGFRTDARARVLTDADEVIPGLYAAGDRSAAAMGCTSPGAGGTIGPATTFGSIAAERALR